MDSDALLAPLEEPVYQRAAKELEMLTEMLGERALRLDTTNASSWRGYDQAPRDGDAITQIAQTSTSR